MVRSGIANAVQARLARTGHGFATSTDAASGRFAGGTSRADLAVFDSSRAHVLGLIAVQALVCFAGDELARQARVATGVAGAVARFAGADVRTFSRLSED